MRLFSPFLFRVPDAAAIAAKITSFSETVQSMAELAGRLKENLEEKTDEEPGAPL